MKSKTAKVAMALVICPLAMLGLSQMLPKRYTASMRLMLDPSPRVISASDPNGVVTEVTGVGRGRSIETEIDKLTGSEVLLYAINLTAQQHPKAFADSVRAESNYANLINRLRIDNNRNSDIVDIRVTMDDPNVAADTANNIGLAYQEYNKKISAAAGSGALLSLNKDIEAKKTELADIDRKIAAIKKKYNMSDITSRAPMQDRLIVDLKSQIAQTQAAYDGAIGELAAAQQQLNAQPKYLKSGETESINPAAVDLDQKISQTSSDLEAMRAKFTDSSPQVRQFADKLASLKTELARTPRTIKSQTSTTLNPNYTSFVSAVAQAQAKTNSLGNSLGALQSKLVQAEAEGTKYPEAERELSALVLEKNSAQLAFQNLMVQKQPLEFKDGAAREAQARTVSIAMPPGRPSFPNPRVFVLMGLAVGIIISALIVMPKAPDMLYAPSSSEALALDGTSIRTTASALPSTPEPEPVRPAIESGKPS